jgi:hypothetical protein
MLHGTEYTLLCVGSEFTTSMVAWYRVHPAMGGKWIDNFNSNMVQSTRIHFPHITRCTLYHVTNEVVNSLHTHRSVYSVSCYHWSCEFTSHPSQGVLCTMLSLELSIHFPPIAGCTLPCYHWSCEFTSGYRVHPAMGGKWIHNFNGNMIQSTHCYGCEVNSQLHW